MCDVIRYPCPNAEVGLTNIYQKKAKMFRSIKPSSNGWLFHRLDLWTFHMLAAVLLLFHRLHIFGNFLTYIASAKRKSEIHTYDLKVPIGCGLKMCLNTAICGPIAPNVFHCGNMQEVLGNNIGKCNQSFELLLLSSKTSYHQISWRLEAATRIVVKVPVMLLNLTDIMGTPLQTYLPNCISIGQFQSEYLSFEALRDLAWGVCLLSE